MASHEEIVSQISVAVRTYFLRKESFRIFHGSNNSTRPAHHSRTVDISALSRVLEIDDVQRTATVEPNVAMDKLVRATLEHGMIPPVVMEFPGITVGGGYAGSAGESSSFKYGYFNETVTRVDTVLGSGDIINASAQNHSDIFKGAAGALGTLGITTKVQLKLIKAKQFVELTYHPYTTVSETIKAIQRAIEDPINDYVDGVCSPTRTELS